MKPSIRLLAIVTAAVCAVLLTAQLFLPVPRHPVALIRVVDATGKPVAGAVLLFLLLAFTVMAGESTVSPARAR